MPIIFLVSAVVSGMALLMVLYGIAMKIRKMPLDTGCLRTLALWLGGFLTTALVLEGLRTCPLPHNPAMLVIVLTLFRLRILNLGFCCIVDS